jgi:hypothetical protein
MTRTKLLALLETFTPNRENLGDAEFFYQGNNYEVLQGLLANVDLIKLALKEQTK